MSTKIEKILVPLDGSELSRRILGPARRLAERTGAEVRAIRVLDGYEADQAMLRGEDPHALAGAELGRDLEPFAKAGIRVGWDTYLGDPAGRIVDDAATYKASLIVMATHGRSGVDRFIRGSVAERVLRKATVPVFLANPHAMTDILPIRRILVPLDGSELGAAALPLAMDFARIHGAEVLLLHVLEHGLDQAAAPAPLSARALDVLDRFAERAQGMGPRPTTIIAQGTPAYGVLQAADSHRADLIAMSTHGRSGVSRWAFGSTAENVLRHARTPLLVVRATGAASQGESAIEAAVAQTI